MAAPPAGRRHRLTRPRKPFLTALWRNLLVVTYPVDDALLAPHLPPGAVPDHLEGSARVSFVAFEFARTRVYGMPIPGHTSFPEINLRFYARLGGERGVVFIREFVPRRAVAAIARTRYNEPYVRLPMRSDVRSDGGDNARLAVSHVFGHERSTVTAEVDAVGAVPAASSAEHWLTHQEFGFGRTRGGRPRSYRVKHPPWALHTVHSLEMEVDFASLYGPTWTFLREAAPGHVTFAAGSEVAVYPPDRDDAAVG